MDGQLHYVAWQFTIVNEGCEMARTETVGVKVTKEMKAALQRAAEADERPLSSMVVMILRDFLKNHHQQPQRKAAK